VSKCFLLFLLLMAWKTKPDRLWLIC